MKTVVIPRSCLSKMDRIVGLSPHTETGGIIIGRYTDGGSTVEIHTVTGPPIDSVMEQRTFVRGNDGLRELLVKMWPEYYYVGEWHRHPTQFVKESAEDRQAMLAISVDPDAQCKCPVMIIIGDGMYGCDRPMRVWTVEGSDLVLAACRII